MDFRDTIAWSQRAYRHSPECTNETLAKSILIIPFFAQLGYDPSDPRAMMQEHQVHSNKKYPNRADIVLFSKGKPVIVVECKSPGRQLSNHYGQLANYFKHQDATLAVLTDGLNFLFFSDGDSDGNLDDEPFFALSLEKVASRGLTETEKNFLGHIGRDTFNEDWVANFAQSEMIRIKLTRWLAGQLKKPTPDFCRYVLAQLNIKRIRDNRLDLYSTLLQEAFSHSLAGEIHEKIQNMKAAAPRVRTAPAQINGVAPKIITTEHEKQIFAFCKNRLREKVKRPSEQIEIDKIRYRDRIEKFCVYYDRLNKGRLFDYYEEEGRDKFIFYIGDEKQTFYDISTIDQPLVTAFRQRLSEAQSW
ncbi:MAG: type I restriction enzyme HsdR N-terminal domain-containing protein [Hyphomicrobiales bacterium]|nr:type I restriction enzyme HsdR N-terminal domain-containing protein [Hyphomicrobiales bacterium]